MAEHVVFLALGGTRRRAAQDESQRVVRRGDMATLVVTDPAEWRGYRPADGVRVLDLRGLELRHAWMPFEQLILVRIPRFTFRIVGLGPVRRWSDRASRAYQRRVADPLHQRAFLPLLRRGRGAQAARLIRRQLGDRAVDLLVVNDPASMPAAVALLATFDEGGLPQVAYSVDDAVPADRD